MKVSLRRASQLQLEINARLRSSENMSTQVEVNEFQNVEQEVQKQADKFAQELEVRKRLIKILFNIREQVGQQNHASGIDSRLTAIAEIDRNMQLNDAVIAAPVQRDTREIESRLEKIRTNTANSYSIRDTVPTGVVSEKLIQQAKDDNNQLKKQKQKLNDQVLELNIRSEIELDADSQEFLTELGIL